MKKPVRSVAAIDLGSNSFHMVVARVTDRELHVIDRLRETVQLATGFDRHHCLTAKVRRRALECLARFSQRLRDMPPGSVHAVGTSALRRARNADVLISEAERVLGHPIDIISGREEARLIYLGVSHSLAGNGKRKLVVDVGGGSTEFIIGERHEPRYMESLDMGSLSMTTAYFPEGVINNTCMQRAEIAAGLELQNIQTQYRRFGWDVAIGASGTILSLMEVIRALGWSEDAITVGALHRLRKVVVAAGHTRRLSLPGLRPERAPIVPAGLAILSAIFSALGLKRMITSTGAIREGLLYDLPGQVPHEDVRERTIKALRNRYEIDTRQSMRVARTAECCLRAVSRAWGLEDARDGALLIGAAQLHEIGLAVAHSQYHKHGAYLIANSDLSGFTRSEQTTLAALVRGHRRKFPEAVFQTMPRHTAKSARRLCVLLRIAVLLHRDRTDRKLPALVLTALPNGLRIRFPRGWLAAHPLTRADLEQESARLKPARFTLTST
ncbi:MAG: Ppx/GppA phosphatase family protein [Acidiferrobacteraceae bacterium]